LYPGPRASNIIQNTLSHNQLLEKCRGIHQKKKCNALQLLEKTNSQQALAVSSINFQFVKTRICFCLKNVARQNDVILLLE